MIGSEVFGTTVMKADEVVGFVKAAIENGADMETAYNDMKLIDNILHMKRLHLIVHGSIKYTKAGYFRKRTGLHDAINDLIEGRKRQDRE